MTMLSGNESAFPKVKTTKQDGTLNGQMWFIGDTYSTGGMTIRQHYAGLAMQGLISGGGVITDPQVIADLSVKISDALINKLNNPDE